MNDFNPNQNPMPNQNVNQNQAQNPNPGYNGGYTPPPMYNPPQYQPQTGIAPPPGYVQKSRVAAGILAIVMGSLGVHSFYLGNNSRGLMQLLISLLTCGLGGIAMHIWGIVEGVRILDGRINTDANGVFLKD